APLHAARVVASFDGARAEVFKVPTGERYKTREMWQHLTDDLLRNGFGRDSAVIALGGGVIGDLAGFVAATFMRGIPYVQVPTTLLAMIDASIGGKTAVDTPAGKNLVGAFHRPAAVVIDPGALATLPTAHLRAGLAEAIKHGVVADAEYFEHISAGLEGLLARASPEALERLIVRSVEIKTDVVREDERESGKRKILNFGHTLGHAIEAMSGYELLHGEAVGAGMALEARLAERIGVAEAGTARRISDVLHRAGLPTERPSEVSAEAIILATRTDKKARQGSVEYALPQRIGEMSARASGWTMAVEDRAVLEILS
ncbi:MAG: 3-dehydroquinate synthase, partial [Gemmatimonadaceae bacterium]